MSRPETRFRSFPQPQKEPIETPKSEKVGQIQK